MVLNVSKSEKVLQQIDAQADKVFLDIISKRKAAIVEMLVKKHKPLFAVETGTLVGYSAIRIARNLPKGGKLISVEINPGKATQAKRNIEAADLSEKVQVIVGDANKVFQKIRSKVDFVFFDVADYLGCLNSLEKNGCIQKGSLVIANNVRWFNEALKPYLNYVRTNYVSKTIDLGFDQMEVSVKK
jgi:predicted O-methyltransferase YrrM